MYFGRKLMLTFFLLLVMLVVHTPTAAAVTKSDLQQQLLQLQSLLQQLQAKIKPAVQGVSTVSYTKTIYVDGNLSAKCSGNYSIANRNCSGSNGDAYPSVQAGVSAMTPGTQILVRSGIYREAVTMPSKLGTSASGQVALMGYGNERPVLTGAVTTSNWMPCTAALCGNNPNWAKMYYTKLPASMFNNITIPYFIENGKNLSIASYPEQPDPYLEMKELFYPVDASSYGRVDGFSSAKLTEPAGYWDGVDVRFWSHGMNNVVINKTVGTYAAGNVVFTGPLSQAVTKASEPDAFMFINSLQAKVLDRAGEYVFTTKPDANNEHTVYVWPYNSSDINKIEVINKNTGILFTPSYFALKQITLSDYAGTQARAGGFVNPSGFPAQQVIVDDVVVKNIFGPSTSGIHLYGVSDLIVSNSEVYNMLPETRGIFASNASRVNFNNNEVYRTGRTAISGYTIVDSVISGNYVHDETGSHGNAYTCYLQCKNVLFFNNIAYNTGRLLLTLNDPIDVSIIGNVFDNNDRQTSNNVAQIRGSVQGTFTMLNNAFLRAPQNDALSLVNPSTGAQYIIRNNIFDGSTNQFTNAAISHSNNIWTGFAWNQNAAKGWVLPTTDKSVPNLSNLFSQTNGAYKLAVNSPSIDSGFDTRSMVSSIAGVSAHTDLNGVTRPQGSAYDIGPLEAISGTTPPPTTPAPTLTLSASPSSVTAGGSATLTWAATNATSCTASGAWSGTKSTSGSQASGALNTTGTQTFSMTCIGTGGSVTQSAAVSVTATTPTTPAPTVTLTASPSSITTGGSATLTWSSTNATACTASGAWSGNRATSGTGSTGTLNTTGIQSYTLTCTGAGGSGSATAVVTVTAPIIVDTDKDTIADATDNCPTVANQNQANYDGDTQGDACDTDDDNDGILDTAEKSGCVLNPATSCGAVLPVTSAFSAGTRVQSTDIINVRSTNMTSVLGTQPVGSIGTVQAGTPVASNGYVYIPVNFDTGLDGMVADAFLSVYSAPTDTDNDGVADTADNCPTVANANQADADNDGIGDACDSTPNGNPTPVPNPSTNTIALTESNVTSAVPNGNYLSGLFDGCTDGSLRTCYLTAGNVSNTLVIELDLGQVYDLTAAKLFGNASGNAVSRTWSLATKQSSTASYTTAFTNQNASGNQWFTQTLSTSARYVQLTVVGASGSTNTRLEEFALTGTPRTGTTPTPTLTTRVMTTENLNVRSTPNGTKLGMQPKGMKGTKSATAPVSAGGYSWVSVDFDTTPDGYVVSTYLAPIDGTTLTESQTRAEIQKLLKQLQELQALLATLTAE